MITIFAPFADRLNLNGDQGNALVVAKCLEALGLESQVISSFAELHQVTPNFVLMGHGSDAAMSSIAQELNAQTALMKQLRDQVPGLVVGSSVIWMVEHGLSPQVLRTGEHESRFEVTELNGLKILGYRNTDSGLASLFQNGQWIECMLHGPVLAKNPALLKEVIEKILLVAKVPVNLARADKWFQELSEISVKVWSVETDLEFQRLN
ncbi:MAG: hypothetical protein ACKORF_01890 [Micrococcales bacterium]